MLNGTRKLEDNDADRVLRVIVASKFDMNMQYNTHTLAEGALTFPLPSFHGEEKWLVNPSTSKSSPPQWNKECAAHSDIASAESGALRGYEGAEFGP